MIQNKPRDLFKRKIEEALPQYGEVLQIDTEVNEVYPIKIDHEVNECFLWAKYNDDKYLVFMILVDKYGRQATHIGLTDEMTRLPLWLDQVDLEYEENLEEIICSIHDENRISIEKTFDLENVTKEDIIYIEDLLDELMYYKSKKE